jgi:hypothetical protein
MFVEKINLLEDELREELIACVSDPSERAIAFTIMKRFNHRNIRAVLEDLQITAEAKKDQILSQFPIE